MRSIKIFSGYVEFEGIGGFQECFLSDIIEKNIEVWDFTTKNGITKGKVAAGNYRLLSKTAKKSQIKLKVIKKHGAVFFVNRHSTRFGIILGVILFAAFLTIMSNFIWEIEVIGDMQIREDMVLEKAYNSGIKIGAIGVGLDLRSIEQKMLAEMDDLAWVGISKNRSKIIIDCRKRVDAPEKVELYTPSNIVAEADGQIIDARVYKGTQIVWEEDSVKKGDILVSGIVTIGENLKDNYVHSRGEIIAKCPETKYIKVPLKQTRTVKTGEFINRKYLNFLGLDIPLFFAAPINFEYTATNEYKPWIVFNKKMPFGITENKYYKTTTENVEYSEEQAKIEAFRQLDYYEGEVNKKGKILEKSTEQYIENGNYIIKASYVIEKDIAKQEILYIK